MKWLSHFICFFLITAGVHGLGNPYQILGIHRRATLQEIRKAYKQLAKEWHPDKNSDPAAENKFVEINQAYELLTDPERRKKYDNFGITEETPPLRPKRDYSQYRRDPFDDLFGTHGGSFKFQFQDRDITTFHQLSVTTRAFENKIVPKSFRIPYLVMFYSDWCFACLQVEPVWRRLIEELEPLGFGIVTVHSENEPMLTKKIGIHTLPTLVVLLDGKASIYRDSLFSVQKIVEFVRSRFPYRLVQPVEDETVSLFLSGWKDNRVRALIFERHDSVRLRYLLMAFFYRERVAFGFVQLNSPATGSVQKKYKVPSDIDTLLLFNENIDRPVASLSMSDMPIKTMQDIINSNKYLMLPRLSSQGMFDALCPPEWSRPRKRLCVVLVSQDTPYHDDARQALRDFAQESSYNVERVRFVYIFQEKQMEFINALTSGEGGPLEPSLHIVIIWRRDANHIKYEWLPHTWDSAKIKEWNETRDQLESTIQRLLHSTEALTYEAVIKELMDEHAQGIMMRILAKVFSAVDYLKDNITKEQLLPLLSVLGTVVFIVIGGYIMTYLVRLEEESIRKKQCTNGAAPKPETGNYETTTLKKTGKPTTPELRLHELRAETYNGMVRLLKPGCRTIVLLVDTQSRNQLIAAFHKTVWPYRKNKTLMFGYLMLDRALEWYKCLLTLSLPEPRDLNINPRNCIGTVLSLNGHRKYFCMYHAKHPECGRGKGSKRMVKMTKRISNTPNATNGAFMGFDTSESDDTETSDIEQGYQQDDGLLSDKYSNVVFQGNLLDGLPNWLDRLFEGTTQRYYINYWPDFPLK
ncbi:dnaJ homolog subfamily C member 16 [Schistocerca americana]|uniref:dnaJ homolog subfamily C member 16 n=1 Tax=Schistocerca americana TaxID=7009 RepID=UPI001F500108|nr:dnaJ homolog subfamily C member 16 [Schistocerca americana]